MGIQKIDAKLLARMFLAGAKNLESKKEFINELNVFPVPDGDTGTNMTMTILSAAKEIALLGDDITMPALCKAVSGGSLRGARGNSGVILSQLFRGFTKRIKEEEFLTIPVLTEAFDKAVASAYKAVMQPKEGTILTVAKGTADKAKSLVEDGVDDMELFLAAIIDHAKYVLSQTPEMLPVLKQAGVVDSGGQGLVEVFCGAFDAYLGKEMDLTLTEETAEHKDKEGAENRSHAPELKYIYNTEYTILLKKNFNIKTEMDFKAYLESIGEIRICGTDNERVKVQLHTNDPGLAVQKGLKFGQLTDVKIENLRIQREEKKAAEKEAELHKAELEAKGEARKPYGFIAVSVGEGVNEIFKSLGVDYIIEGGQTMNPSTADILDAVEKVNADTIFVLPNNKNIILAANQAAELSVDKTLLVIPTKTIPQGITAVINFVPEMSADENETAMIQEIGNVKTGQVTYAVRDTVIDDIEIKKDDYMGIGDKSILSAGRDLATVMDELLAAMVDDASELISIYYGADVKEEDAEATRARLADQYPDFDIELQYGGQPIYYYLISVE